MKFKIDENLPTDLVEELIRMGHSADTVNDEGLQGRPDDDVWAAAQQENRFFITQDMRFSDTRQYEPGKHCGIMLLRLLDPDRKTVVARAKETLESEGNLERCYVVVTDKKVRVRRAG